jgi:hypothetical protein
LHRLGDAKSHLLPVVSFVRCVRIKDRTRPLALDDVEAGLLGPHVTVLPHLVTHGIVLLIISRITDFQPFTPDIPTVYG